MHQIDYLSWELGAPQQYKQLSAEIEMGSQMPEYMQVEEAKQW